jgi:uncharacterized membrane protein YkoI
MLLIGGIGVASAMNEGDRSATASTTATTVADNHGIRSGLDDPAGEDRGTRSGLDDSAGDDRGARSQRDGANLTGTVAQRARSAALAAVPGASVREIENGTGTGGAVYHVELIKRDGTKIEVDLDGSFHTVKIERSGDDN